MLTRLKNTSADTCFVHKRLINAAQRARRTLVYFLETNSEAFMLNFRLLSRMLWEI